MRLLDIAGICGNGCAVVSFLVRGSALFLVVLKTVWLSYLTFAAFIKSNESFPLIG